MQLPVAEHDGISMGETIMKLREYALHLAALVSATCAVSSIAQSFSPGIIATEKGGAVGYRHSLQRSRFVTGATGTNLRPVEEFGFAKVVGPKGIFATNLRNGLVVAVQSGGSDKSDEKAGDVNARAGRVMDPDRHNKWVIEYFLAAGVPKNQIGGVHANTYLSSSGSAKDAWPAEPKIDGYASVLERKIEKYDVVDSVIWARMNEEGKVVSEWIYWPPIPAKALADARRLEELVRSSGKANFLTRLPAGLPIGKVVIRHSSATEEGPFEVFASYDVLQRRTSPATADGKPQMVSVIVRHFGVDGQERRLPQEKRNVGSDFPPKEKEPAQSPIEH